MGIDDYYSQAIGNYRDKTEDKFRYRSYIWLSNPVDRTMVCKTWHRVHALLEHVSKPVIVHSGYSSALTGQINLDNILQ